MGGSVIATGRHNSDRPETGRLTTDDSGVAFAAFVEAAEPRLRRALVAGFGAEIGREATVDCLSWAWEHWEKVSRMRNPTGYVYKVGRTRAIRIVGRRVGRRSESPTIHRDIVEVEPSLGPALDRLSVRQRTAVVLVHGYGYSFREAAGVMGVSLSAVRNHVDRAMGRLRDDLGEVLA